MKDDSASLHRSARRLRRAFGLSAASAGLTGFVFAFYPGSTPDAVMDPAPLIYAGFTLILALFAIGAFIYASLCLFISQAYLPLRFMPLFLSLILPGALMYQAYDPPSRRTRRAERTVRDRVEQFQRIGEWVNPAIIDLFTKEPERFAFPRVGERATIKGLKEYLLSRPEIPAGLLRFSGDSLLDPWGSPIDVIVDRNHDQFLQSGTYDGHPIWHEEGVSNGVGLRMKIHPGVMTSSHDEWALKNSARP